MYDGISPPEKNMVNMNILDSSFPGRKSLRESGYAAQIVMTRLMHVPSTV